MAGAWTGHVALKQRSLVTRVSYKQRTRSGSGRPYARMPT
jgi:hypothetical protein